MSAERRRLALALLLSLLLHTLLLSLTFGGQELGLPGFGFPWQERRIEVPELRVVLMPAPAPATAAEPAGTSVKEPLHQASIEQPVAGGAVLTLSVSSVQTPGRTAEAIVPQTKPAAEAKAEPDTAGSSNVPVGSERAGEAVTTPMPGPAILAMERSDEAKWVVPAAPPVPTPAIIAAPSVASPEAVMLAPREAGDVTQERIAQEARERAVELAKLDRAEREAQRQAGQREEARLEAARIESARMAAVQLEAQRQETVRQEAARVEVARQEAERQEAVRQTAARMESARHAAVRQEAARVEAARQETERVENARLEAQRQEAASQEVARSEAARLEAERQEAVRHAAARKEAARVLEEQEEDARREARRRAMGRQLDEEAARREAASSAARQSSTLPLSLSTARRGRLWGRTDTNAELVQYAEAWARKIQFNTPFDTVRDVAKRPHTNPMVTVAVRSDGSVESVTFVLSSGVAEVDEAIRRIVQSHVHYQAFPPGLAREFDVIEIRRTWHLDMAIRLY